MSERDQANMDDLKDIEAALIEARQALARVMSGIGGTADREKFVFQVGFARGRLSRVSDRIYKGGEFGEAGETRQ